MKKNIHPTYFKQVQATCATCQTNFVFNSTKKQFSIDVCSGCHPVYTGNRSQVKATGRIDRFNKRLVKKQVETKHKEETKPKTEAKPKAETKQK